MGIKVKFEIYNNNKINNSNNKAFIFINIAFNAFIFINKLFIKSKIFFNYKLLQIFKIIIIKAKINANIINHIFIIFLKIFKSHFYYYFLCDSIFK